jgi:HAD superfamily hydrolase (TIGR01549 family)
MFKNRVENLKAIIFDWDGCISDNFNTTFECYKKTLLYFFVNIDLKIFKKHYSPNRIEFYKKVGLPEDYWATANKLWSEYYDKSILSLRTGMKKLLFGLRNKKLDLAIVSSGDRERIFREVSFHELDDFFACIICDEDTHNKKPNIQPLMVALKKLKIAPKYGCYIGDTQDDIIMGKTCGLLTIFLESDFSNIKLSNYIQPDIVAKNIFDLISIFKINDNHNKKD